MKERAFLFSPPHVLVPVESGPLSLGTQLQKFDRRGQGLVIWLETRTARSSICIAVYLRLRKCQVSILKNEYELLDIIGTINSPSHKALFSVAK